MLSTVVLPWLHYLAVLMMAGGAVAEIYLLKLPPTADGVRLLPRVDRFYGIAAGLVLATGLLRMYYGGKAAEWYWHNGYLHGVIGVFVLAALLSLVPTVRFLRWSRALASSGALPTAQDARATQRLVHVQMTMIGLIALLITLVAKGYGG